MKYYDGCYEASGSCMFLYSLHKVKHIFNRGRTPKLPLMTNHVSYIILDDKAQLVSGELPFWEPQSCTTALGDNVIALASFACELLHILGCEVVGIRVSASKSVTVGRDPRGDPELTVEIAYIIS